MTLTEAREALARGATGVVYTAPHGAREAGVITSVNDRWVFVRYGAGKSSAATPAELLTLESTS